MTAGASSACASGPMQMITPSGFSRSSISSMFAYGVPPNSVAFLSALASSLSHTPTSRAPAAPMYG